MISTVSSAFSLRSMVPAFFMIDEVALGPRLALASSAIRSPVRAWALASIRWLVMRARRSASASRPLSSTPT